jgi:hypothetical protein
MIEKKNDEKSAVVSGKGALNNPHLSSVVDQITKGFKPNRIGRSNRQIRIDNTAMIENTVPVWGFKQVTDDKGEVVREVPQLLFRAGWYLSPTENFVKEELMKDPRTKELNDAIKAKMEEQGVQYEKQPAQQEGEKVIV